MKIDQKSIMIDEIDADLLNNQYNVNSDGYIVRMVTIQGKQRVEKLHRYIMERKEGRALSKNENVSFRDKNKMNCARDNLYLATRSQISQHAKKTTRETSSQYKGVSYIKANGKWRLTMNIGGKITYMGLFHEEVPAAIAYDYYAKLYYGEHAKINFPDC